MKILKPYIESSVFIEFIKGEDPAKCDTISAIIAAAKAGAFKITTATWTIAEVHKRKGYSKGVAITDKQSEDVLLYFREEFIDIVEVDRALAERAHGICRAYPDNGKDKTIKPGDAIHISAAERAGCDVIWTYEPDFLKLDYSKIKIETPTFDKEITEAITPAENLDLNYGEPA